MSLSHYYATNSHWLQWDTPNSPPKLPIPLQRGEWANTPILNRPNSPSQMTPGSVTPTDTHTDRCMG